MEFYKYHGAGNDFIILESIADESPEVLAKKICHRRFGVGADGLMYPLSSEVADIKMAYYNSDGSYATMCGNGLRCFAKFVYERGLIKKTLFDVETGDGVKTVELNLVEGEVSSVSVEMSQGDLAIKKYHFDIDDRQYQGDFLELGVPHLVLMVDGLDPQEVVTTGPILEKAPYFKEGTNVNFLQLKDASRIRVDTWERGAGYTYACGTGCCASVYAAFKQGLTADRVAVETKGGQLIIEINEGDLVKMTGPAINICKGDFFETCDM